MMMKLTAARIRTFALWIGLLQAAVSMLGSLIASEVMLLPPCEMCWWQRIAWYPLVPLFATALQTKEYRSLFWNGLVLAVPGWLLSLYQTLLQWNLLPTDGIIPCSLDNPCGIPTSMFPAPLDVITIPFLSVVGFTVILACLWFIRPDARKA